MLTGIVVGAALFLVGRYVWRGWVWLNRWVFPPALFIPTRPFRPWQDSYVPWPDLKASWAKHHTVDRPAWPPKDWP